MNTEPEQVCLFFKLFTIITAIKSLRSNKIAKLVELITLFKLPALSKELPGTCYLYSLFALLHLPDLCMDYGPMYKYRA